MDAHFEVPDSTLYRLVEAFCNKHLKAPHGPSEEVRMAEFRDTQKRTVYFLGDKRPVYEVTQLLPGKRTLFTITPVIGPFCQVALLSGGEVSVSNLTEHQNKAAEAVNEFLKDVTAKGHWEGNPPVTAWN